MTKIRIGSRQSRLAVIQAELARECIRLENPSLDMELVTMKTTGDKILDRTLDKVGGKGLFVKELDVALREGRTDISVHSLKDVPMEVPADLPLLGFLSREDPRDVLVLPKGRSELDKALPLGCSSRRRTVQLERIFPGVSVKSVRGNVLTRLEKLDSGEYGGLVLAAAGLKRLGLEERISRYFTVEELIPAAGQGILAIQGRVGEDYSWLEGCFDRKAGLAATAERAFVAALGGGCSAPIGAYAVVEQGQIKLTGLYCQEEAGIFRRGTLVGKPEEAELLGKRLAGKLREEGGCSKKQDAE